MANVPGLRTERDGSQEDSRHESTRHILPSRLLGLRHVLRWYLEHGYGASKCKSTREEVPSFWALMYQKLSKKNETQGKGGGLPSPPSFPWPPPPIEPTDAGALVSPANRRGMAFLRQASHGTTEEPAECPTNLGFGVNLK